MFTHFSSNISHSVQRKGVGIISLYTTPTAWTLINCTSPVDISARHDTFSCLDLLWLRRFSKWTSPLRYKTAKLWRCWRCSAFQNRLHLNNLDSKTLSTHTENDNGERIVSGKMFQRRHGSTKLQSPRVHSTSERGFVCAKVSDNITFLETKESEL